MDLTALVLVVLSYVIKTNYALIVWWFKAKAKDLNFKVPMESHFCLREELEGTQASKEVIDPTDATLWFANNEMKPENKLSGHLGKNEKTKVVVKVSTRRGGQPVSESWLDEENQKKIALMNYRKVNSRCSG